MHVHCFHGMAVVKYMHEHVFVKSVSVSVLNEHSRVHFNGGTRFTGTLFLTLSYMIITQNSSYILATLCYNYFAILKL